MMWRRSTASGSVQETSRGVDAFVREPGGELAQNARDANAGATLDVDEPAARRRRLVVVRGARKDVARVGFSLLSAVLARVEDAELSVVGRKIVR